jgi:hypothetical protein
MGAHCALQKMRVAITAVAAIHPAAHGGGRRRREPFLTPLPASESSSSARVTVTARPDQGGSVSIAHGRAVPPVTAQ